MMYPSTCILLITLLFLSTASPQDEAIQPQPPPFFHRLLNCVKIKTLYYHLFPPDLDFRGRINSNEAQVEGGTGEKVKEAVAVSLEKGKSTVEESAKSAAEKLKDAFSHEL